MSTYKELFSLNLMHDYYSDGKCPDFNITPTPECKEFLEDYHIIFKNKITGIQLVVATNDGSTPFIDISDVSKFTFYMKLNESAFGNYTVLDDIDKDKIYAYDNQAGADGLTLTQVKRSEITPPISDTTVFGVIDIYAEQLSDLSTPSQYTISFTASALNWSYYFIVTQQSPEKTISIYNDEITFSGPETLDDLGQELGRKYPDNSIQWFQSDVVSHQQKGRKSIELRTTDGFTHATDTLIEHLPNPSIDDNGIKILKVVI